MASQNGANDEMKEKKSAKQSNHADLVALPNSKIDQGSQLVSHSFPVVGIGASAGGLAAFESFFTGIPEDSLPEIAFVIIQHLAPDKKSMLTEIIKRYTSMKVFEVEDGMTITPKCIYIIPPNRNMALLNGSLQLFEFNAPRGQNMPVDFFFRSLASDQHEKAVCVVLSGTGSDGTLGLRAVKGEGGMAIAQKPDTTEYSGMPGSAIATGLVDYQLPPDEMAKQIFSYVTHAQTTNKEPAVPELSNEDNTLSKIFMLIRNQTGHDFSKYKQSTINRRIERRLAVLQVETMSDYLKYIQQTPTEIDALFRDLLIGVTSFFRDKEVFKKLEEEIIPKLFMDKPVGTTIRAWCAGCSTGEEAYSIAILLQEHLELTKKDFNLQVFATDIDGQAIAIARSGVYPGSITEDLTSERIDRFFTTMPGQTGYRINKTIRDMLVFSEQSIIKDPPFSKLDFISCRNLFIYLSSDLQKDLIPLFHYALNPKGILFLGSSETVGDADLLFDVLDRRFKFYQRKEGLQGSKKAMPAQIFRPVMAKESGDNKKKRPAARTTQNLKAVIEQAVLNESSIAGVLVNAQGDILYIHGRTGMYFEPSQGETGVNNVIEMAREGLKRDMTLALHKASVNKEIVHLNKINVKTNGHFQKVNLVVKQALTGLSSEDQQPMYIILLDEDNEQEHAIKPDGTKTDSLNNVDQQLEDLRIELRIKEEYLQTANEALKLSNEEMQSVNEELQSANEELETSKEELQSINEELSTVNSELQVKVHDLSQANNDMNNLLSGTNIATIFLDLQQNILRFTPTANRIINLILSDIGRPVAHISSNFIEYNQLTADVETVLDTLVPKEIQVQIKDGHWYNMMIQPYRTIENVTEGAVITFVDITETKKTKDMLAISEMLYRTLFEATQEGVLILDGVTGKIKNVNPYLVKLLGYPEKDFLEKEIWDIGSMKDIVANKEKFTALQKQKYIRYKDLPLVTAAGDKIDVEFISCLYEIDQHKIIQCNIREKTGSINAERT